MRLTRLELNGFKSFADSVDLTFEPGITAIVGPNGCGKSNISDAVRWVLGEQRASLLRGSRMDEVIFQGSVKRRPINLAEVASASKICRTCCAGPGSGVMRGWSSKRR